ncbi:hypothetical protein [Brevibacillus sp. FIR094]|uniref:hypothetical protein n=1 Tax=Brevibacillus sp. FIR094 TaxID=3134809 RepID=UPI003D23C6FB
MDKTYKLDGRVIRELLIMPIVDTLSIASSLQTHFHRIEMVEVYDQRFVAGLHLFNGSSGHLLCIYVKL